MGYTNEEITELRKESTFISKLIGLSRVSVTKVLRGERSKFSQKTISKIDAAFAFRAKQNQDFKAFITDFNQLQK